VAVAGTFAMAIEQYLLADRYLEPLGWLLIGVTIVAVEAYNYATAGATAAGGLMLAIGAACLLVGGRRWTDRESIADGEDVSVLKHAFLALVLLVIVGSQFL
jgi:hypothetical protein